MAADLYAGLVPQLMGLLPTSVCDAKDKYSTFIMDLTPAFLQYLGNRAEKKVTPTSPVELNRI